MGVLTRVFPPDLVDRAIAASDRTERRNRTLPARVTAYFSIGMALYSEGSEVLTSAGAMEVAPRVDNRRVDPDTGARRRFSSAILPPWCRKTRKITEMLPLLYLRGLSSGDFGPALGQFLRSTAGLLGPVITKLTETWKANNAPSPPATCPGPTHVYLRAGTVMVVDAYASNTSLWAKHDGHGRMTTPYPWRTSRP